jgi:hypothetical protein
LGITNISLTHIPVTHSRNAYSSDACPDYTAMTPESEILVKS